MRVHVLRCGESAQQSASLPSHATMHDLPEVPSQRELKFIGDLARDVLPEDPTPSLEEIAAQPDVRHLGAPKPAPQRPSEALRLVVMGTDAACSAVLTRLMRSDTCWIQLAYVPDAPGSTAAQLVGTRIDAACNPASPVRPAPLIRDDAGVAVTGSAEVLDWDNGEVTAEIIVDDEVLLRHEAAATPPQVGVFGARLVPTPDAPGLAATTYVTSPVAPAPIPLWSRVFGKRPAPLGRLDADRLLTGRALQAGGANLKVMVDGVARKRTVDRATFYRHLRDAQWVG